ncbi:inorganic pyrophosphatase [Radiomyces spectabilis]|uniref:inorganic pyrophosphatase n=1 Tax=Radiomyces spectabilis TaxID=64574 RepID=UPI002221299D|nr:inorganic pyrophosphatase [Radiomyces spectabilis]KAI8371642.1 inorganic pyrophosphatase [Radiomyces spectabilis]
MKIATAFCILVTGAVASAQTYKLRQVGAPYSPDFRAYFEQNGTVISPFHDIPLKAGKDVYNMVVEIPRWTNAKFEINKETELNPIIQDQKNGTVRFVCNLFPYNGYLWNYGAFPQTWEDPNYVTQETHTKGDNDPIDVIEIGDELATMGQVKQVKILGILGLLDQGETDWKVIVIDTKDKMASKMKDIEDVKKYKPGLLEATNTWFTYYKVPTGDKKNKLAFNGESKNREYATRTVEETHEFWKALVNGTTKAPIKTINMSQKGTPGYKQKVDIPEANLQAALPLNDTVKGWSYVDTD